MPGVDGRPLELQLGVDGMLRCELVLRTQIAECFVYACVCVSCQGWVGRLTELQQAVSGTLRCEPAAAAGSRCMLALGFLACVSSGRGQWEWEGSFNGG